MPNLANANLRFHTLEILAEGNTMIHSLHPLAKTITTFLYVVIVVSFGPYELSGLLPFFFYPIILMALGDIPYKPLLARMAVALPFGLFAGTANLILVRETALYFLTIPISYGMISFFSIIVKTLLTVMAVLILISTTPLPTLSRQLTALKIPSLFILLLSMIYRYIGVLVEEALAMYTAYTLRSPDQKGIKMKDMGIFIGQLLLKSVDRAERIYQAMKCRGFTGSYEYIPLPKMKAGGLVYLLGLCAVFSLLRFFNLSLLLGNLLY